ncbi:MAG: sugar phosphate isomerase/epimerase [Chloroflexi bacterium]|nr:sugar phosphate isomerase/epimerase [Chloroflexota bacterium]
MKIACCIWALAGMETEILREARALGFDWIDIQPTHLRALESRLLAQELGLRVSCVGASFAMPAGAALDHADADKRKTAFDNVASGIALAGHLGAESAYVVPGKDSSPNALARFRDSLAGLADLAAGFGVKLALEHFPGTTLPTASETLEFIRRADHPNLYLLIDSGHLQMTGEEPASAILNAGDRLGYMHFDDNDGVSDLHWALLDGVMTEESLDATLQALADIDYQGALSLELSPGLPNPARALAAGRDALLRGLHRL